MATIRRSRAATPGSGSGTPAGTVPGPATRPATGSSAETHAVLKGSTVYLAVVALFDARLRRAVFSFIGTAFKKFFFDQFMYRMRLRAAAGAGVTGGASGSGGEEGSDGAPRRALPAVKNVEHRLDALVPVRYETVAIYLTFIQLWISAASYLRRAIGPSFNDDIAEFLVGLRRCYNDASGVYGRCLSTTRRPAKAPSPRLAFIYAVDPHLFCVPSLHVLVVCYTYKRLEELLAARGFADRFSAELAAIRGRAVAITESILYVRQHSVNCIPTALAMLGVITPAYGESESKRFLAELFEGDERISAPDRRAILEYMDGLYDAITSRGYGQAERYGAIAEFLEAYEELEFEAISAESASPSASGAAGATTFPAAADTVAPSRSSDARLDRDRPSERDEYGRLGEGDLSEA